MVLQRARRSLLPPAWFRGLQRTTMAALISKLIRFADQRPNFRIQAGCRNDETIRETLGPTLPARRARSTAASLGSGVPGRSTVERTRGHDREQAEGPTRAASRRRS